jgi:hypothetical protein
MDGVVSLDRGRASGRRSALRSAGLAVWSYGGPILTLAWGPGSGRGGGPKLACPLE